jgi:hypothetical protein
VAADEWARAMVACYLVALRDGAIASGALSAPTRLIASVLALVGASSLLATVSEDAPAAAIALLGAVAVVVAAIARPPPSRP